MDLMACDEINRGVAKYKRPKKRMTTEEIMRLK